MRRAEDIRGLLLAPLILATDHHETLNSKAGSPSIKISSGLLPPPGLSGYAKVLCTQSAALIGQL